MSGETRQHKMGPVGECICPKRKARNGHRRRIPCQEEHCPACGAKMPRVGSDDYQLWLNKQFANPEPWADPGDWSAGAGNRCWSISC